MKQIKGQFYWVLNNFLSHMLGRKLLSQIEDDVSSKLNMWPSIRTPVEVRLIKQLKAQAFKGVGK